MKCYIYNIFHNTFTTLFIKLLFFFLTNSSTPILAVLFLSFLLNIDMCMYSYTELTNSYTFTTLFIRLLFFFFFFFHKPHYTSFGCVVFVFSFKYLYVYIQLHWLNKFLQYFHNYWQFALFIGPFFFTICWFCLCF